MPRVHVVAETTAPPEQVLAAARDFSYRRAELWPDVHVEHLEVHETGHTWAEVTEGNPWPLGRVWERLRYDWSQPGVVRGTVVGSNIFKPGSTWELRASPAEGGGSLVEIVGVRHLKGIRGRMLWPLFPLGLARRDVADHLRHFLAKVEEGKTTATDSRRRYEMDKAAVDRWLDAYVQAWKTYDRDRIASLFAESIAYRYHPYDEPIVGRDAVVSSWLGEADFAGASTRDEPGTYDAAYRAIAVDGDVAVATGTSSYRESPGGPVVRIYENCFVMRFDEGGRCTEFTEYYVERPK